MFYLVFMYRKKANGRAQRDTDMILGKNSCDVNRRKLLTEYIVFSDRSFFVRLGAEREGWWWWWGLV